MKAPVFIILFLMAAQALIAEDNLKQIMPTTVLDYDALSLVQKKNGVSKKHVYKIYTVKLADLSKQRPWLLSESVYEHLEQGKDISLEDIKSMLHSEKNFILKKYLPFSAESSSYKKIRINNEEIGEVFFGSGNDGLLVSGSFVYTLAFVDDDRITEFWINFSLSKEDMDVLSLLPELFNKKGDLWYWNTVNSRKELFYLLERKDKKLPDVFIELQKHWEEILENLEIDGVKVTS